MINNIRNHYKKLIPIIGIGFLLACTKEKTPTPVTPEPTKWEKIAGHYKVYDTTGIYLYDMDLIHSHNDATDRDSIRFVNFDGEFTFTAEQQEFSSIPFGVTIGGYDTLYDSNNKRWKLWAGLYLEYYNILNNDTLPIRFQKTNINYYIEDVTPYYACDCKQIAVKQH